MTEPLTCSRCQAPITDPVGIAKGFCRGCKDFTTSVEPSPMCDFCPSTRPRVHFGCADFIAARAIATDGGTLDGISQGHWGACERCAAYIDVGDRAGLERELLAERRARVPDRGTREFVEAGLRTLWSGFWRHRTGQRSAISYDDLAEGRRNVANGIEAAQRAVAWFDQHPSGTIVVEADRGAPD